MTVQKPVATGTDALKQAVVEHLMRVITSPDDPGTAREADEALQALDASLRTAPAPVPAFDEHS